MHRMTWHGTAWHSMGWHRIAWHSTAYTAWHGMAQYCTAWAGIAWHSLLWHDIALDRVHGTIWHSMAWHCPGQHGTAHSDVGTLRRCLWHGRRQAGAQDTASLHATCLTSPCPHPPDAADKVEGALVGGVRLGRAPHAAQPRSLGTPDPLASPPVSSSLPLSPWPCTQWDLAHAIPVLPAWSNPAVPSLHLWCGACWGAQQWCHPWGMHPCTGQRLAVQVLRGCWRARGGDVSVCV